MTLSRKYYLRNLRRKYVRVRSVQAQVVYESLSMGVTSTNEASNYSKIAMYDAVEVLICRMEKKALYGDLY